MGSNDLLDYATHGLPNLQHFLIAVFRFRHYPITMHLEDRILTRSTDFLCLETFVPHLGGGFTVLRGDEWMALDLAEATPVGGHRARECEKFSLIFAAGPGKPLQQGIHEFRHGALGTFELFITPVISPAHDVSWYEASVNRETAP
jgi:hypothetical protein